MNTRRRRRTGYGILARIGRAARVVVIAWIAVTIGLVLMLRWVDPPTTAFMLVDRLDAYASALPGYVFRYRWVDWGNISNDMKLAVVAAEDQRFSGHFGFDFVESEQALSQRSRGVSMRGASTISQQTAKNLFLWQQQSWARKGLEAYFTLLIEAFWPKTRILEVYLNVAEFSRGVFGVGAASEYFFRRHASHVSRLQSALLAAVLPNPIRFRVEAPSAHVRARQAWIVAQMGALGGVQYVRALESPSCWLSRVDVSWC